MTPEQQTLVAELKATIEKAQQQLAELEQPKYTYPMWFKSRATGRIVKFTGLTKGDVVIGEASVNYGWEPHTNSDCWVQVPEPKQQLEPEIYSSVEQEGESYYS